MGWQWLAVGAVVAVATAYLVRRAWRTWFAAKAGCGGGCGCVGGAPAATEAGVTLIPPDGLRLRQRSPE